MDHPLYQIEKVLQKGQDNVDDMDNLEAYLEVRAFVCVCTCGDCPPPPPIHVLLSSLVAPIIMQGIPLFLKERIFSPLLHCSAPYFV